MKTTSQNVIIKRQREERRRDKKVKLTKILVTTRGCGEDEQHGSRFWVALHSHGLDPRGKSSSIGHVPDRANQSVAETYFATHEWLNENFKVDD